MFYWKWVRDLVYVNILVLIFNIKILILMMSLILDKWNFVFLYFVYEYKGFDCMFEFIFIIVDDEICF